MINFYSYLSGRYSVHQNVSSQVSVIADPKIRTQ